MKERLNPMQVAPAACKAMPGLQAYVNGAKLEHDLVDLVNIRASQINGRAFCLHVLDGWNRLSFAFGRPPEVQAVS